MVVAARKLTFISEAAAHVKSLTRGRSMATAPKLTFISKAATHLKILIRGRMVAAACKLTFISEATTHEKILTVGRMVAMARNLTVFFRQVLLDIRRRSCEATRRGEKDCMACNLPVFI